MVGKKHTWSPLALVNSES